MNILIKRTSVWFQRVIAKYFKLEFLDNYIRSGVFIPNNENAFLSVLR